MPVWVVLILGCAGSDDETGLPPVDADGDGADSSVDCDESDPQIHPAAVELCDGVDNDCDGDVDEAAAADVRLWYPDADGDGHGDPAASSVACAGPSGWVNNGDDCDDGDGLVHPGAEEICDELDNDCDGDMDGDEAAGGGTFYADVDGDGHGDANSPIVACAAPSGYVAADDDCDDSTAEVYPGLEEVCDDGRDNDCDGSANDCRLVGSWTLDAATRSWTGSEYSGRYGSVLGGVGDLNGDGFDDVLHGAPEESPNGSGSGAVTLIFGPDGASDWALPGASAGDALGASVAGVGDFNGDGRPEAVIGAPYANGWSGAVVLIDDTAILATISGTGTDLAGLCLAGEDELVVGLSTAVVVLDGPFSGEHGVEEARATLLLDDVEVVASGDADGDGISDVFVGLPGGDAVMLFLAPSGALEEPDVLLGGTGRLGTSLGLADLDGDGLVDLAVGAPEDSAGATKGGAVHVYTAPFAPGAAPSVSLLATASLVYLGDTLATDFDFDGDAVPDLVIGAYGDDQAAANAGAVRLEYGPLVAGTWTEPTLQWLGESSSHVVGSAVGVGDFDGDGRDEVFIGGPGDDEGAYDAGAVWMLKGLGW